ncbi:E3 ubiquitin-protein ligase RNF130 isoform X3, partial [Tachysurus ichikawai]
SRFLSFLQFICFSFSLYLSFDVRALSPLKTSPTPKVTPPPFTLLTEEWFIVGSFAVLSVLTLCYMIIRATGNNYDNTV